MFNLLVKFVYFVLWYLYPCYIVASWYKDQDETLTTSSVVFNGILFVTSLTVQTCVTQLTTFDGGQRENQNQWETIT